MTSIEVGSMLIHNVQRTDQGGTKWPPKVGKTSSLEKMSIAKGSNCKNCRGTPRSHGHPSGPNPPGLPVLSLQNRRKGESRKVPFKAAVVGALKRQQEFM